MTKPALSKDQLQKLTPDEQETFGAMEIRRLELRQQLLERAGRWMPTRSSILNGLLTGLVIGLAGLSTLFPRLLPFAVIAVAALVGHHATRLHRRFDALMELLDHDIKRAMEREQDYNDGHAGKTGGDPDVK